MTNDKEMTSHEESDAEFMMNEDWCPINCYGYGRDTYQFQSKEEIRKEAERQLREDWHID